MLAKWINPVALAVLAAVAMTVDLLMPEMRIFIHSVVYFLSTLLCLEVARDYDHKLMRLVLATVCRRGRSFSQSVFRSGYPV